MTGELGSCSYLVVGAGAPALAFIDTLLTLNYDEKISKDAPIVLIDRHDAPGGHWNDAYEYVRLHQPSLVYGVSSKQLEGNWFTNNLLKFRLPFNHRASQQEILAYYAEVVATWEQKGLVKEKLVDATAGECIVPSAKNMPFRIEEASEARTRIQVRVPSDLHTLPQSDFQTKRFCVLGGGKTGMDALVWLQREKGVKPEQISWVVGRETWMLNRENLATPGVLADRVLDAMFPITDSEELSYLRKPELTKYRQGYVAKLELFIDQASTKDDGGAKGDEESVRIHFKEMDKEKQAKMSDEKSVADVVTVGKAEEVVFIHCTAPGPFNGRMPQPLYQGSHQMNLMHLSPPPVPQSASTLAWIETGRRLNAAYGGEHGALRESVEKILGGERGGATMSLSATPENFAHVWNTGILNCLDFVKRSASSKAKRCRTCTSPRVRVAPPARSGYPLPPGFDKFPSYRTFLDGNRLMAFGPPPIRRQHLETMEKLEACMSKV
eukprot:g19070.t1